MSDSDSDSVGVIQRKGRIYRKRNHNKENYSKMIKYYSDPEKRAKLVERIKGYKDAKKAIEDKINKLEQYLVAFDSTTETHPDSG
jgi:hypothetical protein